MNPVAASPYDAVIGHAMKDQLLKTEAVSWQDIAMPAVLMMTGFAILALASFHLLSLDQIQNCWPAAFLLMAIVELVPVGLDRRS
jgi:hypothetical protein